MVGFQFNKQELENRRRVLRRGMTAPEIILWFKIRSRQLCGLKFKRQFSIGNYIIDFYCPEKRLAVELDGESHFEENNQNRDKLRDSYLRSLNIAVLRFTNDEIMNNMSGVLDRILGTIHTTSP